MTWRGLSKPLKEAEADHQIIVVGSGYGGGVAASRLARAGQQVTVLERGREIAPEEYPREADAAMAEFQTTLSHSGKTVGKQGGLYDIRVGDDMNVILGCGLGGTSLINANVAIEPDPRVYKNWPKPFRDNPEELAPYFDRARTMLGSQPYPADQTPPKLRALERAAKGIDAPLVRPDINVTFEAGHNAAGVWQNACNNCGDCVSGCNYHAKNTVLMNYLPDAEKRGALIYRQAEVLRIAKIKAKTKGGRDRWSIFVRDRALHDWEEGAERELTADMVILAAGSLGSTEILLRSADQIGVSDKLGEGFSGNGDVWAFGYNANIKEGDDRAPVYGIGAGPNAPERGPAYAPGPCITGMIDLRDIGPNVEDGLIIEDGVMPGALAAGYAGSVPVFATLMGDTFRFGDMEQRGADLRDLADLIADDPMKFAETAYQGPVSRTLPFLVMSHDSAEGRLEMHADRVRVHWPDAGLDHAILQDEKHLRRASDAIQAEYIPFPLWQEAFGNRLVVVHPIGGSCMAETAATGVANHKCQVFDGQGGLHETLYVVDGAVLPKGVGVNPHLTIAAVAERAVQLIADDNDWTIDWSAAKKDPVPIRAKAPEDDIEVLLKRIQRACLGLCIGSLDEVREALKEGWAELYQLYDENVPEGLKADYVLPTVDEVMAALGSEDAIEAIVRPIAKQGLELINPIVTAYRKKDFAKIFEILEEQLGDFSPRMYFRETMRGNLSRIGLHDPEPLSDPYRIAAFGDEESVLVADVGAESVRALFTPPDGEGFIRNGVLSCPELGADFDFEGTFRFLMPNPDEIERWDVTYRGTLTEQGSKEPRVLRFDGFKILQRREGSHWWSDVTELFVDIFDGDDVVARGVLAVKLEDLIVQAQGLKIDYEFGRLQAALMDGYHAIQEVVERDLKALPDLVANKAFRATAVLASVFLHDLLRPDQQVRGKLEQLYSGKSFGRLGLLILRTYAAFFSYMWNFPSKEDVELLPRQYELPQAQLFYPEVSDGLTLKLTRYQGGTKGPLMVAGGFGTRASSFALETVDVNLVEMLVADGFDVWLFDYRGSGDIAASQTPFTIDDVAQTDWPAAIDTVVHETGAETVQAIVHCVASVSLFMAILAGENRVRSFVASQIGPHAISNWVKFAQADSKMAGLIGEGLPKELWPLVDAGTDDETLRHYAKHGFPVVDPCSPSSCDDAGAIDPVIDAMLWNVPSFAPVPCTSPTCHRINFIFGPSYRHEQLNQETHKAIKDMFGPVSSKPFQHLAEIFRHGHVVSADGADIYRPNMSALDMPIHFIAGGENQEMLPEATLRTWDWLRRCEDLTHKNYTRTVYPGYGHMDCFIGKSAAQDIFPDLLAWLNSQP